MPEAFAFTLVTESSLISEDQNTTRLRVHITKKGLYIIPPPPGKILQMTGSLYF